MVTRSAAAPILGLALLAGAARADLACPQPRFDAGPQRTGVALRHRFLLVNRGNEAIRIVEVKPGCGCLKPALDRDVLAPGEQASVSVEVGTVTQAEGRNAWRVLVRYREGQDEGEVPLYVEADLVSDLSIQPAALLVHTSTAIGHTFTLRERREKPLTVRAAASCPHVDARVGTPERDGEVWRRAVELQVGEGLPAGRHEGVVCLYTDDPSCPELKVPFTIVKRAGGAVTPTPAAVELLSAGAPLPARVVLLGSADGSPVLVERVEPNHASIRCSFAEGPGARSTLRVQVDRDKLPEGRFAGAVRVYLRQPAGQVIEVPVQVVR
jgi:hypothetical protein